MESSSPRTQLGKYVLVAEIARGGMGIVYLARMSGPAGFRKLAVVKQLKPELAEDDKFREMFMDEARLAARLNHRNIVQTNEVGEDDGRYFMAMEYLEGRTLQSVRTRLKAERALSTPAILRIACDALAGLHYAHELTDYDGRPLGIVHRDVSAQNVFITYDGQVKVLDFGVAKALANTQETEVGMLKGRVVCMSPEQVANDAVDRRADVFSMGVLLRETLTNTRLWDGLAELDVLRELVARRIPPFPDTASHVPAEVRAIVERAMAPVREDRFPTAHAMRVALEQCVIRIDPSGSLAEVGDVLSRAFADQRERVKATLDQHVNGAHGSDLPVLPASGRDTTSSVSQLSRPSGVGSSPRSGSGTLSAGEMPSTAQFLPARRGANLLLAGVAVVAVAVAVGALLLRPKEGATRQADARPLPSQAMAPVVPPPPASPASPEAVDLTVRATPAGAAVYIDDSLVENPWHARYPQGGTHSIRITAPGYAPKVESVTLSAATHVSISLERATSTIVAAPHAPAPPPRAPEPPPKPVATPDPVPAPPEIAPGGGKAPKRAIDPKNPYQ